ncbi:MAG: hypothetical protein KAX38_02200 [Candidatus Krumholzibacteria bacterium]|nr:hypothetical protein [Candidatus Krumholzibacteria bacterium]
MKPKGIIITIIIVFVIASAAYLVIRESHQRQDAAWNGATQKTSKRSTRVIAYYFHWRNRCQKCRIIEAYAREAIEKGFCKDLENGRLEWRVVNVDEPQNKHFIQDYKLSLESVVLVDIRDGKQVRWKKLREIWDLVDEKTAFISYVRERVKAHIRGK